MKIHATKSLLITAVAAIGLCLPLSAKASGYSPLTQHVYNLDRLADGMAWQYAMEARYYAGCPHAAALLAAMKTHSCNTDTLLRALHGTCPTTFKNAACAVRNSLTQVQNCRANARVSPSVCAMIQQSCPLATYVHNNSHLFQPVAAVAPSYGFVPQVSQQHHVRVPQRSHGHSGAIMFHQQAPQPSRCVSGKEVITSLLLQALSNGLP